MNNPLNLPPDPGQQAFGETLGLPVPTRYPLGTHDLFNAVLAVDSIVMPNLLRLNWTTRTLCNGLAILLILGRGAGSAAGQRQRLQIELATGIALFAVGLTQPNGVVARIHLMSVGILIIANALMTQTV